MNGMPRFNINVLVHRITHPISLIVVGLIVLAFLAFIKAPFWMFLLVTLLVLAGVVAVIRYPELRMEQDVLRQYLADRFRNFQGDTVELSPPEKIAEGVAEEEVAEE